MSESFFHTCVKWLPDSAQEYPRTHQSQIIIDYMKSFLIIPGGHPGVAKAIMRFLGLDLGPARPPIARLNKSQEAALREDLDKIGFFGWR